MPQGVNDEMDDVRELRSVALTPTWSVASVLTIFIGVSLLVERSLHWLALSSQWLKKTKQKPLLAAMEKMKDELMLLGFMSLLLTATSSAISSICIPAKLYDSALDPCTKHDVDEDKKSKTLEGRKLLLAFIKPQSYRRMLSGEDRSTCPKEFEPFVSDEGLEQLHHFMFVMAVTHISYSCLTMVLAVLKVHRWRVWEDEVHMNKQNSFLEMTRLLTVQRQSTFVGAHTSNFRFLIWMTCFFRQFWRSVDRVDYLTLRQGFIESHNLTPNYDFHSYMIRSMEEEFQMIVGVSAGLWGFVVAFMLFNVNGSNLYFWIALVPFTLVLFVGAKLQHVVATLAFESMGISGSFSRPRDELFWFNKPELLLRLIHFILFQNSFELATFFWVWLEFGYNSCFLGNHFLVLVLGFAVQFLCSYSTLPLYALATQMGTNYKAALIPDGVRETIHGWGKEVRRRRRKGAFDDDSTVHTDTGTAISANEYNDDDFQDTLRFDPDKGFDIELQCPPPIIAGYSTVANDSSSRIGTPLLRPSASISSSVSSQTMPGTVQRSSSLPR